MSAEQTPAARQPEDGPRPALEADHGPELLAVVLDSLPDAASVFDHAWRWLYVNRVGREQLGSAGHDADALVGRCVWDELPALRATRAYDEAMRAVAERRVVTYEEQRAADGRWIEHRIVPTSTGAVAYARDISERHRAAEAAREREARFRRMFVESPLPMWIFDPSTTAILDVNDAAVRHYGYERADFLALTLADLRPAEDVPKLLRLLEAPHDPTPTRYGDLRHRTKDGTLLDVEVTTQETEVDGRPARIAVMLDVTARARAAARTTRLQAVTAALSATLTPAEVAQVVMEHGVAALGASAAAVATLDDDGRALTLLGAVGYQPAAIERFRHVPLDAAFPLTDAMREGAPIILATNKERDARYPQLAELRRANGGGAMAAIPLVVGDRRVGVMGINFPEGATLGEEERRFVLALTHQCAQALERARLYDAERVARQAAERLQALTAALSGAATLDDVGRIVLERGVLALGAHAGVIAFTSADGSALDIVASTGYPEAACMGPGRSWPASARMPITDAARSGEPVLVESLDAWRARYPGGHAPPRTHNAAWAALPLHDGTACGALLWTFDDARTFSTDQTALMAAVARLCAQAMERARLYEAERAAHEDAERLRTEAEAANQAKSDFLTTMSHELRTPLNAIAGYAQLLEMGIRGPVTDAQREDLHRIQRSQRHLLSLVNDVLNFARIDAGQARYDIADVCVAEVVTDVGTLVAPQLAANELTLAVDGRLTEGASDAPTVRADREKFGQILLNLLANAIKFTPAGGRISLDCITDGAAVRLHVTDTGIGIPPELHAAIFEPFVQVQRGLTRTTGGTGLGLAISRDLARAMEGDIEVASTVGTGSTFTLTLRRGGSAP